MKGIIKIIILFFILIYANRSIANTVNIIYTVDNSPITNVEINNEITYLKLLSKELMIFKKWGLSLKPLLIIAK